MLLFYYHKTSVGKAWELNNFKWYLAVSWRDSMRGIFSPAWYLDLYRLRLYRLQPLGTATFTSQHALQPLQVFELQSTLQEIFLMEAGIGPIVNQAIYHFAIFVKKITEWYEWCQSYRSEGSYGRRSGHLPPADFQLEKYCNSKLKKRSFKIIIMLNYFSHCFFLNFTQNIALNQRESAK